MIHPRRGGIVAISWCVLLTCILCFDVPAGEEAGSSGPEFRFRDGDGTDRAVGAGHLWFQIYTGPSKTAKYSTRAVYDPESHMYVNFKEMSSFTVKRAADGYVATFTMRDEPGARTLPFHESGRLLGEEYVPAMVIKLSGRSKRKHEHILLEDVVWPIEVKN